MAAPGTLDLEPFIREAVAKMSVEIDKRMANEVADVLRGMGWVCIPPAKKDESNV